VREVPAADLAAESDHYVGQARRGSGTARWTRSGGCCEAGPGWPVVVFHCWNHAPVGSDGGPLRADARRTPAPGRRRTACRRRAGGCAGTPRASRGPGPGPVPWNPGPANTRSLFWLRSISKRLAGAGVVHLERLESVSRSGFAAGVGTCGSIEPPSTFRGPRRLGVRLESVGQHDRRIVAWEGQRQLGGLSQQRRTAATTSRLGPHIGAASTADSAGTAATVAPGRTGTAGRPRADR